MTDENRELLKRVVASVLEQFAFMFVDEPDDGFPEWKGEYLHAAISFKGPGEGTCSISAPEPLCRELAGNVLGVMDSDDLTSETSEDALKEFLNVVGGEFVAELFGKAAVVHLSVPSLCRIDRGKWNELSADAENIQMLVEGQAMMVSLLVVE